MYSISKMLAPDNCRPLRFLQWNSYICFAFHISLRQTFRWNRSFVARLAKITFIQSVVVTDLSDKWCNVGTKKKETTTENPSPMINGPKTNSDFQLLKRFSEQRYVICIRTNVRCAIVSSSSSLFHVLMALKYYHTLIVCSFMVLKTENRVAQMIMITLYIVS